MACSVALTGHRRSTIRLDDCREATTGRPARGQCRIGAGMAQGTGTTGSSRGAAVSASPDLPLVSHHGALDPASDHGLGTRPRLVLFTWWLTALARGPRACHGQAVMHNFFGWLVLFGFTAILFFHAANGVRHLAGCRLRLRQGRGAAERHRHPGHRRRPHHRLLARRPHRRLAENPIMQPAIAESAPGARHARRRPLEGAARHRDR